MFCWFGLVCLCFLFLLGGGAGGEFCDCCAGKLKRHGVGIQERFFLCLEIFLLYGFFVQQFGLVANEVSLIEREREREREMVADL